VRRDRPEDALRHFEFVAYATRNRIIDETMAWSWAGDRILAYWYAFEIQIDTRRRIDETYWEDLAWLVPRLEVMNTRRGVLDWRKRFVRPVLQDEARLSVDPA
jgi:hypothetical protein